MIRKLSNADFQTIFEIVNDAAVAYKGKIPADCYKTPYMPQEELREEIEAGVQFYGITVNGVLAAVMGIQPVGDVTLIRHAYTLTSHQRQGLGEQLLNSPAWIGQNTADSSRHMGSGTLGNPILPFES